MTDGPISSTVAANPPALSADPQDPLPESNWFWRRVLVFIGEASRLVFIGWVLTALYAVRNTPLVSQLAIDAMFRIAKMILIFGAFDRILYLVAPSAEQVIKMMQSSNLLQAGVHTFQRSTLLTPEGTATAETRVGMPGEQGQFGAGRGATAPLAPPAAPSTPEPPKAPDGPSGGPEIILPEEANWK